MLHTIFRTAKFAIASLEVETILAHFGITAEQLMREVGLSTERIEEYAGQGLAWAGSNVLLESFFFAHPAKVVATSKRP